MIQKQLVIQNRLGLHARAAAKFVRCACRFDCEIEVQKDGMRVNGKSIIGVLLLAAPRGSCIDVMADGPDEGQAIAALTRLVQDRFDEA